MRVAELVGVRQFQLADRPAGGPAPGEVEVRIEAVGVCGSDLHVYSDGRIGDTPMQYPVVLGHEPAGLVTRVGAGVTGLEPGDRVACEPAIYCYHCEHCRAGRHNVCAHLRFLSTPPEPGFFRERVNLPAANLLPVPRTLSAAEATLVEPLAVVLHSMKFAAVGLGDSACVFGAGPIGLLTVALLRLAGARRVLVVEPVPHRRALALRLGADAALDPAQADPVAVVRGETGGRGVDLAIDCASVGETSNACLAVTRNAGRVVITGIPSDLRVPLDVHTWRRKELSVAQVRRSNHEGEAARDLLVAERARFAPLVTHQRPLARIGEAFALCESYDDGVGKLVVTP